MEKGMRITVQGKCKIIADTAEGAQFLTGDGSVLELTSGAAIEMQNPRIFPWLQIILQNGGLVFTAQSDSYEFIAPTGSVKLLSTPLQLQIELGDEGARVAVEEGSVTYTADAEVLTLTECQETYAKSGEKPRVDEFCVANTVTPTPPLGSMPGQTVEGNQATPTLFVPAPTSIRSVPTSTPPPVVVPVVTRHPSPLPPTETPTPVPRPDKDDQPKPKKTDAPPTNPPPATDIPTDEPATEQPPTDRPTMAPNPTDPRPTASSATGN